MPVNHGLVTFELVINGSIISDVVEVYAIKIDNGIGRVSTAEVTILDGSIASGMFDISSSSDFLPGNSIEIKLGYDNDNHTIFKGVITGQNIRLLRNSVGSLIIECTDKSGKIASSPRNKVFEDSTDSEVMIEILQDYSISAEVTKTQKKHPKTIQQDISDWGFIVDKAAANGMVVSNFNNEILIDYPNFKTDKLEALEVGDNIIDFDFTMDATTQFDTVIASSWSVEEKKLISATASEPKVPAHGNLTGKKLSRAFNERPLELLSKLNMDESELKRWAGVELLNSRMSKIQGSIETHGNLNLKPNTLVRLSGLGNRFNGDAYITSVRHYVHKGDWRSFLTIGGDTFNSQ